MRGQACYGFWRHRVVGTVVIRTSDELTASQAESFRRKGSQYIIGITIAWHQKYLKKVRKACNVFVNRL
jgi:hypothetical protein